MPKVTVDIEKLTKGLERGIGDTRTLFASCLPNNRLRMAACGLVSSAIIAYALQEGVPCRQVISCPNIPIDPTMQHVMPVIGDPEDDDPLLIDASASLFLGYAGLTLSYEKAAGEKVFPPEKIIAFSLAERQTVVHWLTSAAIGFRKINKHPVGRYGFELGDGPLVDCPASYVWANYDRIYNPANYSAHKMIERVREDGIIVSRRIPKNAIIVS